MRLLLTAGPTREHLDPVRFLSNGSSGTMGFALAEAGQARGWTVDLVAGPVALPTPVGVRRHDVVSAAEMLATCESLFAECDLFIAVAAVADFRPKVVSGQKLKPGKVAMALELVPTEDVLQTLAARRRPGQTVVGFAAETHDVLAYAERKRREKGADWMVANDVSQPGLGMNSPDNAIWLLGPGGGVEVFGPAPKRQVADFILERVSRSFPTV